MPLLASAGCRASTTRSQPAILLIIHLVPSVSKVHLLVAKSDGLLLFRDMCSTNGTKVNGQRVIRGMLLPNDKLQIAACKFQVQLLPSEPVIEREEPQSDDAVVRIYKADELAQPQHPDLMQQFAPRAPESNPPTAPPGNFDEESATPTDNRNIDQSDDHDRAAISG